MNQKKRIVHVLIHGFAVAHATAAATLAQTVVGDEATLTALTITMIIAIARLYGQPLEVGTAFAFLGTFAGFYLGTRGAVFFIKLIPIIGNGANAIATFATTETLGWVTYYLVSSGRPIRDVTKDEVAKLIKERKKRQAQLTKEWEEIEKTISSMEEKDKDRYSSLVKKLKDANMSEEEQTDLELQLTELFNKYNNK